MDVKVEVQTVEVKSEKSLIRFTPAQVESVLRSFVTKKKKLPDDVEFSFTSDHGCTFSWKKEAKKEKSIIAGEKPTAPTREKQREGTIPLSEKLAEELLTELPSLMRCSTRNDNGADWDSCHFCGKSSSHHLGIPTDIKHDPNCLGERLYSCLNV